METPRKISRRVSESGLRIPDYKAFLWIGGSCEETDRMVHLIKEKAGRNDPCPCGSGVKYKKCCLTEDQPVISLFSDNRRLGEDRDGNEDHKQEPIVMTTTEEPLMPIRLYYDVFDKKGLLKELRKLDCVSFAPEEEDLFSINYEKEAQNIPLSVPYNQVPKEFYPVLLAFGYFVDDSHLQLDLRSFDRAVGIIEFIDEWIDRSLAKITHVASYNQILAGDKFKDLSILDLAELFEEDNMVIHDPEATMDTLEEALDQEEDQEEKRKIAVRYLEKTSQQNFPLVEKYPIYYYEEGIHSVKVALMLRSIVAMEHRRGNTSLKPIDVLQGIFSKEGHTI